MFDVASRQKLRFESSKGLLSVEDLWDLPLTSTNGRANLDEIALYLHRQLRDTGDVVSFVDDKAKTDPVIQLRFDIVKHIIETRKKENAEALAAKDRAQTKQRLLEVLAKKRDSSLEAMSEEDLLKKLAEL
jgi:hypothetical protein